MDTEVELTLVAALACLGLGLAWAYEADYFAPVKERPASVRPQKTGSTPSSKKQPRAKQRSGRVY
jgi:hypothetical protein